jgi:hypothetical protein
MDEETYASNIETAYRLLNELDPGATGEFAFLKNLLHKSNENDADRERNWKQIQNMMSGLLTDPPECFISRCSEDFCDEIESQECVKCHESFCENHIKAVRFDSNDSSNNPPQYQFESYVCSECFRKQSPRSWRKQESCSKCQRTDDEDEFYTNEDGEPVCTRCFSTEERCDNCGEPWDDTEWECEHMRLCSGCEIDLTPVATGDPCSECVRKQYG